MSDQYKASVMTFDSASWGWDQVGAVGFTSGSISDMQMAVDSSGRPYVAYADGANGGKVNVMRFNGTSWEQVGVAGFSPSTAYYIKLALDSSGTPYVAYADGDGAKGNKVSVMKFVPSSPVSLQPVYELLLRKKK